MLGESGSDGNSRKALKSISTSDGGNGIYLSASIFMLSSNSPSLILGTSMIRTTSAPVPEMEVTTFLDLMPA